MQRLHLLHDQLFFLFLIHTLIVTPYNESSNADGQPNAAQSESEWQCGRRGGMYFWAF